MGIGEGNPRAWHGGHEQGMGTWVRSHTGWHCRDMGTPNACPPCGQGDRAPSALPRGVRAALAPLSLARRPRGPAPCRVLPSADPARRILAPALPFQRLNLPLRAMLCQVEKSQNKAAPSTKTPPPCGTQIEGRGTGVTRTARCHRGNPFLPARSLLGTAPSPQRPGAPEGTGHGWGTKLQPRGSCSGGVGGMGRARG